MPRAPRDPSTCRRGDLETREEQQRSGLCAAYLYPLRQPLRTCKPSSDAQRPGSAAGKLRFTSGTPSFTVRCNRLLGGASPTSVKNRRVTLARAPNDAEGVWVIGIEVERNVLGYI